MKKKSGEFGSMKKWIGKVLKLLKVTTITVVGGMIILFCFSFLFKFGFSLLNDVTNRTNDEVSVEESYVAYRAYDDEQFSWYEKSVLRNWLVDYSIDLNRDRGLLNERDEYAYEMMVNDLIERSDSSEGHVEFKRYVLEQDAYDVLSVGLDGKLDERERELLKFAGDVIGKDVTNVVFDLEDALSESERANGVKSYEDLVKSLSKKVESDVFDVKDVMYVWDREDNLFRVN